MLAAVHSTFKKFRDCRALKAESGAISAPTWELRLQTLGQLPFEFRTAGSNQ